jgi:hypothetical protein
MALAAGDVHGDVAPVACGAGSSRIQRFTEQEVGEVRAEFADAPRARGKALVQPALLRCGALS